MIHAPHTPHRTDHSKSEALLRLRQYVATHLKPGAPLPANYILQARTGLSGWKLPAALNTLDDLGEVCYRSPSRSDRRVLGPGDAHPNDIAVVRAIRDRIASGQYTPGQALPVGLLARQFDLTPTQVADRACRDLVREKLVYHDVDGPYGPGIYVKNPTDQATAPRCRGNTGAQSSPRPQTQFGALAPGSSQAPT